MLIRCQGVMFVLKRNRFFYQKRHSESLLKKATIPELVGNFLFYKSCSFKNIAPFIRKTYLFCEKLHITSLLNPIIAKTVYKKFCGGESIFDALETAKILKDAHNTNAIFDFVIEDTHDHHFVIRTLKDIIKLIDGKAFLAIKMSAIFSQSQLIEKVDLDMLTKTKEWQSLLDLCHQAASNGVPILIDAEYSEIQGSIKAIALKLMQQFNRQNCLIYTTVQMYLRDSMQDLDFLLSEAQKNSFFVGIKLVRGAYLLQEPAILIHKSKEEVDLNFDISIHKTLANDHCRPIFATHNKKSLKLLSHLAKQQNLAINVGQLLGMGDSTNKINADSGIHLYKYIPFGPVHEAIPYLLRRLEENSSISKNAGLEAYIYKEQIFKKLRQFLKSE